MEILCEIGYKHECISSEKIICHFKAPVKRERARLTGAGKNYFGQVVCRSTRRVSKYWVEGLPPEVAAIVKLRFYEELSLKEISLITGAPLSTVKTRLYTGLKKLRLTLEGELDYE